MGTYPAELHLQSPLEGPSDCGAAGCGVCEVCEYLGAKDHAQEIGARFQRDTFMEAYLSHFYGGE